MNGRVRALRGMSIRAKAMLLISLLVVGILSVVAASVLTRERARGLAHLRQRGVKIADTLATTCLVCLLRDDVSLIGEIGDSVRPRPDETIGEADLRYLSIVDLAGNRLYAWGTEALKPEHDSILTGNIFRDEAQNRIDLFSTLSGEEVMDVSSKMTLTEVDGFRRVYGACRVGLSLDGMRRRVRSVTRWVLAALGLFIALGILLAYLATRGPIDHLHRMARQIDRIAGGDFAQRVPVASGDELGLLSQAVNSMAEDLEKRELLKRYISKTAWDDIELRGTAGHERDEGLEKVTILFMDIRNFTTLSESRHTHEIVELLNEVFSAMVEVIELHGGVVDKFIGDALLVVFYPEETGDDAMRAVFCAAEMQERIGRFNRDRAFYGREAIRIGVGINSGDVITGSVGSEHRKDYTVIGDPVNVASRLQELSKESRHTGVVLSRSTLDQVGSVAIVERLAERTLRGKQEMVACYELVRIRELDDILRKMRSEQSAEREVAFKSVEARPGPEALEALVALLSEKDQDLLLRAVMVLGRIGRGDERVALMLERLLETAGNDRLLATAIKAVVRIGAFPDLARIVRFLEHSDPRVRANTVEALDQAGGDRYVGTIARLVEDPAARVKANASVALWKRRRFEVVDSLCRMGRSPDPGSRSAAAFAAGEVFKISVSPLIVAAGAGAFDAARAALDSSVGHLETLSALLLELLNDREPRVVASAVQALARSRDSRAIRPLVRALSGDGSHRDGQVLSTLERIGAPSQTLRALDQLRRLASRPGE
ncbi:MAG: HEAT repeat domain-containing protein [Candidatus Wallbacteria bacterium]|nr:HEAT repeat domain-containing protein [Candidatus Wallbacteria bacterium]